MDRPHALLLVLLLIATPAYAEPLKLTYYGIEEIIENENLVRHVITLRFSEPISHLDYKLGFRVQNLTSDSRFKSACSVAYAGDNSIISCDFENMTIADNLFLKFATTNTVKQLEADYQFSVNYGVSLPVDRVFARIVLPEKGRLAAEPSNSSYYPQNGKTVTDGRIIWVFWESESVPAGETLQYSVLYNIPLGSDDFLVLPLAAVILAAIVAGVIYIRKTQRAEAITSVLNQDENAIVNILEKNHGKALQKVLVRDSSFSKAKVSRLVKSLRQRNIVAIEPVSGRENRIILAIKGRSPEAGAEEAGSKDQQEEP